MQKYEKPSAATGAGLNVNVTEPTKLLDTLATDAVAALS